MVKIVEGLDERILGTMGIVTPDSKAIMCDNILVGIIDYRINQECIKIMYINICDEHRRQGIARKVIEMLKEQNKGKYMYGDALPGTAVRFWESLGAEFDEDEDDYLTPFHIEC